MGQAGCGNEAIDGRHGAALRLAYPLCFPPVLGNVQGYVDDSGFKSVFQVMLDPLEQVVFAFGRRQFGNLFVEFSKGRRG